MTQSNVFGTLGGSAEEDFGGRRVRVLFQEVMLDFPCVVVTKPVGQLDLSESVLIQNPLVIDTPWTWQLQFIKDPELHGWFPVRLLGCECATGSRPCQERRSPDPRDHGPQQREGFA